MLSLNRRMARGLLETLERGNLFIIPLDDQRQWYRYHHLFTEVLAGALTEAQPDPELPCTSGQALGMNKTTCQPRQSAMHWPPGISSAPLG